jgi:hypothetical protein
MVSLEATTWYVLTVRYTDAKWPYASPNHPRGIAEALTDATEALLLREAAFTREIYVPYFAGPRACALEIALMNRPLSSPMPCAG